MKASSTISVLSFDDLLRASISLTFSAIDDENESCCIATEKKNTFS